MSTPDAILILEDDTGVATLQRRRLERSGYRVEWAPTAEAARRFLAGDRYDLLLLDYRLPDAVDGIAFYQDLAAAGLAVPAVMVTGLADERVIIDALRAGVRDFVTKSPAYLDYLPEAVGRVMEQERTARERRRAETALRESEERLRLFVEHAPAALAMFDREMRYLAVSHRWLSDYGLGDTSVLGRCHYDVFPELPEAWRVAHRRAMEGEVVTAEEDRFARVNGSVQWVRWALRPWRNAAGGVGGIVMFTEDVTVQVEARAALRESQTFVQSALDSLGAHVAVVDPAGRIQVVNAAWERSAATRGGNPATCGVGANYLEVCRHAAGPHAAEAATAAAGIRAVLAGDRDEFILEYPCDWSDERLWFIMTATPLGPDRRGVVVSHTDISARKKAEEAVREANARLTAALAELRETTQQLWQTAKLATLGELAASVAHELNNPLGTISLRLEGVLASTAADDPRRAALTVVEGEVERMASLIAHLLNFSRRSEDQISTVDVAAEARTTAELANHHLRRSGITKVFDVAPAVPPVLADRQKLRQVFLNLYTNAADAMPKGGTLTTRVSLTAPPDARRMVVVEVSDTGTGISADILPRVIEPFFTTKREGDGTGLGLAICRRIIHDHKGELTIDSEVGKGTTVRIALPANGHHAH